MERIMVYKAFLTSACSETQRSLDPSVAHQSSLILHVQRLSCNGAHHDLCSFYQAYTACLYLQRDPEVAGSICGAPELTSDFMYGDSVAMERIMIYGAALDAYQSLEVLHSRGACWLIHVLTQSQWSAS